MANTSPVVCPKPRERVSAGNICCFDKPSTIDVYTPALNTPGALQCHRTKNIANVKRKQKAKRSRMTAKEKRDVRDIRVAISAADRNGTLEDIIRACIRGKGSDRTSSCKPLRAIMCRLGLMLSPIRTVIATTVEFRKYVERDVLNLHDEVEVKNRNRVGFSLVYVDIMMDAAVASDTLDDVIRVAMGEDASKYDPKIQARLILATTELKITMTDLLDLMQRTEKYILWQWAFESTDNTRYVAVPGTVS